MDSSLPGSFAHRIFQARGVEWVAISFSIITFIYYVIYIKHLRAIKILDIVYVQWFYFISESVSHSVVSDSVTNGLQPASLLCPPLSCGVSSNSCLLSWWCYPTLSSSVAPFLFLPSIFRSIRVFSDESALHIKWLKYWSFSLNISPSSEYSGLISFRIDWFNLLAVRGLSRVYSQHHSSKAWILWQSAFFIVQLSYPHMTTRK